MSRIHVCALSKIDETVAATQAGRLLTLINKRTPVERPATVAAQDHLYLAMSDITEAASDEILPEAAHVHELLAFVRSWDRKQPIVIHCYAGVSRSTAAAFITKCALDPACSESAVAALIRAMSPTATPNILLVRIADQVLGRNGRMVAAIEAIGRGAECFEGVPFALEIPPHAKP